MLDLTADFEVVNSQRTPLSKGGTIYRVEQRDSTYDIPARALFKNGGSYGVFTVALFHSSYPNADRPDLDEMWFASELIDSLIRLIEQSEGPAVSANLSCAIVLLDTMTREMWLHPLSKDIRNVIAERDEAQAQLRLLNESHTRLILEKEAFQETMQARLAEQGREIAALQKKLSDEISEHRRSSQGSELTPVDIAAPTANEDGQKKNKRLSKLPIPRSLAPACQIGEKPKKQGQPVTITRRNGATR